MINLIRADIYSLHHSKTMKLLLALSFFGIGITAYAAHIMASGDVSDDIVGLVSFFSDFALIPLIGSVAAASLIVGDFDNKTIQDAVASGSSRRAIVTSKGISYSLIIVVMMLPYMLVSFVLFLLNQDFAVFLPSVFLHLMGGLSAQALTTGFILRVILAFFTTVLAYISQLSICIFLCFTIRKPTAVIGIGYGANFLFGQLATLENFKELITYTPFGIRFTSLLETGSSTIYAKALLSSSFVIAAIFFITYYFFRKAEIK